VNCFLCFQSASELTLERFCCLHARLLLLFEQLADFLLHVCMPLVQLPCQLRLKACLSFIDLVIDIVLSCPQSLFNVNTPRLCLVHHISKGAYFIITQRDVLAKLFEPICQLATALVHILVECARQLLYLIL